MTPLFPAQRAAEEFERVLSGTADDAVAARYAELRDAVEQLRTLPEVTPRAEFVGDLRSRLMTAAETELVAVPKTTLRAVPSLPEERTKRRNRRLGTIAASLVVVGGTAGMAAAASGALPGRDPLPDQARHRAGHDRRPLRRRRPGQGAARPGRHPARRGPCPPGRGQRRPRRHLADDGRLPHRRRLRLGEAVLQLPVQRRPGRHHRRCVTSPPRRWPTSPRCPTGADTVTNDLLRRRRRHPGRHRRSRPATCAARCAPTKPLASPNALSAGAGAATVANLLARPVSQVKTEAATIAAARAARIKALRANAESQASKFPLLPAGTNPDGTPNYSLPRHPGQRRATRSPT